MWIVRLALRRPYTIAVMALLILVLGALSLTRMVVDIFPTIDIPVVAVAWNYPGLSAEEMERRVVVISERAYSTTVNGIERIESQSIPGIGLLRVYFHPGTEIGGAIAQISAVSNTILRLTPPGMQPPTVVRFNASNVPVAQLTASSATLSEDRIFDYGLNFIRVRLFTIPGLSTPAPFGGRQRQVSIDINPQALAAKGLSPADLVSGLQNSNVIVPAGTARVGTTEYNVALNASPSAVPEFERIPLKVVNGAPVLLGDVARVTDGYAEQTNVVRVNGKRATYLAILKHADASTLAVVEATREAIPAIEAVAPEGLDLKIDFDQSLFVRAAIAGVVREGVLAAALVSLMIFLFLGSWRSVAVVSSSIPLAIFAAFLGLKFTTQTINIMTLGGLALAIGMLVDDATVAIENIHRNRAQGKPLTIAILDGSRQVAIPAIVATLSICIVFFPVVLLYGPAKYLFTPLALAVVFAMLASYVLSRTLVPLLSRLLMPGEEHAASAPSPWNRTRDALWGRFQAAYGRALETVLAHRAFTLVVALVLSLSGVALLTVTGADFFPAVDAGLMKLHFRAPPGTRIEETERLVERVERRIRETIPASELATINDMIGVPLFYNLAFVPTDNIGAMDAEILVALKPAHHATEGYRRALRASLPGEFPGSDFYFQPADIVSQVLNFGVAAPVDVQIEGANLARSYTVARRLRDAIRTVPGAVDVHIAQVLDYPALKVDVDRGRAAQLGLSERDVANSMLISLSSSGLLAPSFFLNPANNVNYIVSVQTPIARVASVPSLLATPLTPAAGARPGDPGAAPTALVEPPEAPTLTLGNVASVTPGAAPGIVSHYTVQRVLDVEAGVEGRDLGSVVSAIRGHIAALGPLPAGMRINVRGQGEVMSASFRSLGLGLILAILLVYCLMVVLFQSWIDPFIIMAAVPGALVGILWMLALSGTTLNVESLMGSIMAVGIAVSNSILLVSFANDTRVETGAGAT
ncbi:MAG TPA: efflux RND transporter permease subunit, partial [Gemmatimonadales bacterium]|nr:efflux RND transporter permease subunit [Gemmatimonadales bacterium]